MEFQCISCGAALDSTSGMVKCPYCGSMNQVATVVLTESLRIETINEVASILIPRWTALPASVTEIFSTGTDNQSSVSVHIVQGESDHISKNRNVGNFTFDEIAPAPRAKPRIQFTFEVRAEGRLIVTALNLETQKEQTFPAMRLEINQRKK
ncbi:MAG: Hsp70 family protein [Chloroflexi bacterium]|nr:Hsp70 family protein [Chloroflexota bacterium]